MSASQLSPFCGQFRSVSCVDGRQVAACMRMARNDEVYDVRSRRCVTPLTFGHAPGVNDIHHRQFVRLRGAAKRHTRTFIHTALRCVAVRRIRCERTFSGVKFRIILPHEYSSQYFCRTRRHRKAFVTCHCGRRSSFEVCKSSFKSNSTVA